MKKAIGERRKAIVQAKGNRRQAKIPPLPPLVKGGTGKGDLFLTPHASRLTPAVGFTLIELLLVMAIVTVVLSGVASLLKPSYDAAKYGRKQSQLMSLGSQGMDKMTRELSEAKSITSVTASSNTNGSLTFKDSGGASHTFSRGSGGGENDLLLMDADGVTESVDQLKFSCYDENGTLLNASAVSDSAAAPLEVASCEIMMRVFDPDAELSSVEFNSRVTLGRSMREVIINEVRYSSEEIIAEDNMEETYAAGICTDSTGGCHGWGGDFYTRYAYLSDVDNAGNITTNTGGICGATPQNYWLLETGPPWEIGDPSQPVSEPQPCQSEPNCLCTRIGQKYNDTGVGAGIKRDILIANADTGSTVYLYYYQWMDIYNTSDYAQLKYQTCAADADNNGVCDSFGAAANIPKERIEFVDANGTVISAPSTYGANKYDNAPTYDLWNTDHKLWVRIRVDLSTLAGANKFIALHWYFFDNGAGTNRTDYGWYVDNIQITATDNGDNTQRGAGVWQVGNPVDADATKGPESVPSGSKVWGTVTDMSLATAKVYPLAVHGALVTPPATIPSGSTQITFEYKQWMDLHGNWSDVDGDGGDIGVLEISESPYTSWIKIDDGVGGFTLAPQYQSTLSTGTHDLNNQEGYYRQDASGQKPPSDTWETVEATLPDSYAGKTVKFRFRVATDRCSSVWSGWYIDDIKFVANRNLNEWVELKNVSDHYVDVNGWKLYEGQAADDNASPVGDTISGYSGGTTKIPPGGYAVVGVLGTGVFTTAPEASLIPGSAVKLVASDDQFGDDGLDNDWDRIYLKDGSGKLMDFAAYNTALFDDFEHGSGDWVQTDGNYTRSTPILPWHLVTYHCYSPGKAYFWGTDGSPPDGTAAAAYPRQSSGANCTNCGTILRSKRFDISTNIVNPTLAFWTSYDIDGGNNKDNMEVGLLTDAQAATADWSAADAEPFAEIPGTTGDLSVAALEAGCPNQGDYVRKSYSLSPLYTTKKYLHFRVYSDNSSENGGTSVDAPFEGVVIDNVVIYGNYANYTTTQKSLQRKNDLKDSLDRANWDAGAATLYTPGSVNNLS